MARFSEPHRDPLRICILAEANPLIWIHHYVRAFRDCCDVLTVGPSLTLTDLEKIGKPHLSHLLYINDVDTKIDDVDQLESVLPSRWRPHLVIGIQSGMGIVHGLPRLNCPTAYISVDTWHSSLEFNYAMHHDFAFVAQREFVPLLQDTGSRHVRWLPLACSPSVHRPVECVKDLDIAFVGSCGRSIHERRRERLKRLSSHFKVGIGDAMDEREMRNMLGRAHLVFNSSIVGDLNMRVFEALAMGATLLTDRAAARNGLLDLFQDGEQLVTYDDNDLLDVARRYMNDAEARQRIGNAGRRLVLERDTYSRRVQTILNTVLSMIPNIRDISGPLVRDGGSLRDHIPFAPQVLVDFGLGLGVSKFGLRRLGAKKCIGVTCDAAQAQRRAGSYDEMILLSEYDTPELNADTLVLANPTQQASGIEQALVRANRMLRAGGALVASLTMEEVTRLGIEPTVDGCAQWVEAHGYVFLSADTLTPPPESQPSIVITARKRTKTVRQVCAEVYEKHPMPNVTLDELLAMIPEKF